MKTREIKFRAWDTKNSRMVYDPYFFEKKKDFYDNPEPFQYYEDWRDLEDGRSSLCYIMQFTELRDKNEKEIYEGDILKGSDGNVTVKFSEGAYWFMYDEHNGFTCDWFEHTTGASFSLSYEVAGNIHEKDN